MTSAVTLVTLASFGILPETLYAITSLGGAILFQIIWQISYLLGFKLAEDYVLGIALMEIALIFMSLLMLFWL